MVRIDEERRSAWTASAQKLGRKIHPRQLGDQKVFQCPVAWDNYRRFLARNESQSQLSHSSSLLRHST